MVITAAYTCLCSFILQTLVCFGSATRFSCRCPLFWGFVFILRACILFTIDSGVFLCFAWFLFLSLYRYMHWLTGSPVDQCRCSRFLYLWIWVSFTRTQYVWFFSVSWLWWSVNCKHWVWWILTLECKVLAVKYTAFFPGSKNDTCVLQLTSQCKCC